MSTAATVVWAKVPLKVVVPPQKSQALVVVAVLVLLGALVLERAAPARLGD